MNIIVISCYICLEVIAVVLMEIHANRLLGSDMWYSSVSVVSEDGSKSKSLLLIARQCLG